MTTSTTVGTPAARKRPDIERFGLREKGLAIRSQLRRTDDVLRLHAQHHQLQRDRLLAKVEKEKQIEQESLRGELTRALKEAERERIRIQRGADGYVDRMEPSSLNITGSVLWQASDALHELHAAAALAQALADDPLLAAIYTRPSTIMPIAR